MCEGGHEIAARRLTEGPWAPERNTHILSSRSASLLLAPRAGRNPVPIVPGGDGFPADAHHPGGCVPRALAILKYPSFSEAKSGRAPP